MENYKINIDQILIIGAPSKKRMLRIINEDNYEQKDTLRMGRLFCLIDANLGGGNAKIFDILNEGINRYYHNHLEYDVAFDDLISFLNRRASQMFPDKNINDSCSIAVGLLKDSKLIFCATGGILVYFLYPQGVKKIFPENKNESIDVNNKLFGYSLSGEILKNHIIYFCNHDFSGIINPYYLEKIIKSGGVKKTLQGVKDYLIGRDASEQCAALFIHRPPEGEKYANMPAASITELFLQEQKTSEGLSPSLISAVSRFFKKESLVKNILKYGAVVSKKIFYFLKRALFFSAFLSFNFFFIITNIRGKRKEKQRVVSTRFKSIGMEIADFYKSLTAISKMILFSIICLSILLSVSVAYGLRQQKIKKLKLSYQETIETAEKLYNDAEADILFQQKNSAIKKLGSALKILAAMPREIRDTSYNQLQLKIKDNYHKVQNILEISSPVLIADFSLEKDTQIFPPLYLEKDNINISSQNELINVDIKNQNIKKTALARGLDEGPVYYYPPATLLYIIKKNNTIQEINSAQLMSSLKEIVLGPDETIKNFSVYNGALYTLSPSQKYFSIWKHNPSLVGFGKPTLWVTDNSPVSAAPLSLAVDNNVYVLFSGNQIYKYYHGQRTAWKYSADSVSGGDTDYFKIINDENLKNIYLLDKKRISVISEEGEFLAHYLLPFAKDIRDAAIDETSSTIYVLDGKKIYAFSYQL